MPRSDPYNVGRWGCRQTIDGFEKVQKAVRANNGSTQSATSITTMIRHGPTVSEKSEDDVHLFISPCFDARPLSKRQATMKPFVHISLESLEIDSFC